MNQFEGAIFQMRLETAQVSPAGKHLELWVRDGNNDIIRIKPYTDEANYKASYGLQIRVAVSPDDPCLINFENGYMLTDARAYKDNTGPTSTPGVPQSAMQQAESVINRISQINSGGTQGTLLVVVPYDTTTVPTFGLDDAADRLAACKAAIKDPNYYVPNPAQVTTPINGTAYGFIGFKTTTTSTTPPADYDGLRIDEPDKIVNPQEVFLTEENDTVDPLHRGPVYTYSKPIPGGRDIPQFQLFAGFPGGPTGNVAIENNLNTDPVQF